MKPHTLHAILSILTLSAAALITAHIHAEAGFCAWATWGLGLGVTGFALACSALALYGEQQP